MVSEFKANGGWDSELQGILELGIIILQLPQVLHDCQNIGDDLAAIKEWGSIFTDPKKLSETIAKHMALHHKAITSDIASLKSYYGTQEYWKSGLSAAQLATDAIGPITPSYPEMTAHEMVGFDAMSVPDFIAGLIYGFTGDN